MLRGCCSPNVIQRPEAEPVNLVTLTQLFQAVWKAFKSGISCNDASTNSTKAHVCEWTQEANLVRVQDRRTMGAILGQNTFKFSSGVMDDDRSSEKALIQRGRRPEDVLSAAPSPSAAIGLGRLVMLKMLRGHKQMQSHSSEIPAARRSRVSFTQRPVLYEAESSETFMTSAFSAGRLRGPHCCSLLQHNVLQSSTRDFLFLPKLKQH